VRQLVELVNSGIQPLQNLAVLARVSSDLGERSEWVRHFNRRGLQALESCLSTIAGEAGQGQYCVGDALTLADLYLVPQVATALRFDVALDDFPRVVRIYEACMLLDAAILSSPARHPASPDLSPPA
jgi:glutathione S-transferase